MGALVLDKRNEIFNRTVSGVFYGRVFLASRIEFEGRETANVIRNII
jgi:hypothetical protein